LRNLRSTHVALSSSIDTRVTELENLQTQETQAIAQRAHDKATYFAAAQTTQQVLEALEVILPKLRNITPHTAQDVFMELAKLGASNPIAALVEVASALNPEALSRCIGLLEDLQSDFRDFLVNGEQNEIDSQYQHDEFLTYVKKQRKQTKKALKQDRAELVECENTIVLQKTRLENNTDEKESAINGFNVKNTECNAAFASYESSSTSRAEELAILQQVSQIVATKLQGLNNFLETR